jgi:transposase-like protein
MKRTTFTNEEVTRLMKNPCVFCCTNNSINYTYEFKKNALELHAKGVTAREIWRRSGFDTSKWKGHYFRSTLSDWKEIVKKRGVEGLLKVGGIQYDRGPINNEKDKIKRLELQVKYLKAENDFLAKLRAKRAERNSGRVRNTESSTNWDPK